MSETGRRIRAVLGSMAVTALFFLGAEVAVRVVGVEPKPWPSAEGAADFPGVRVDPLLGPLPRPNWSGEWMSGFAVSTDAHGFRSSGLPPPEEPRSRVVFLGDSCTFGWGVDTAATFQTLLDARRAKEAKRIEILNAAYPGQSAVSGEYMLAKRVLPLDPTQVVLGFGANNAFRFSVTSDAERFRSFRLRDTLLRSRLFHIAAAALANRRAASVHPRAREKVQQIAPRQQKRVAAPEEFAAALHHLVAATRDAGAKPVFLIFPRASSVSEQFPEEDVGRARLGGAMSESERKAEELRLLELSCLDQQSVGDPLPELREGLAEWKAVYPDDPAVRELLRAGARAYRDGDAATAHARFAAAIERQPDSPLAHYDLGVASFAIGRGGDGLDELVRADSLACSIFLRYQLLTWKVARDLDVPVVDLTLFFQAAGGEPLFLDQAHPNEAGQRIIADALWNRISDEQGASLPRE
jgi:lysophospholipase L1-like esterase